MARTNSTKVNEVATVRSGDNLKPFIDAANGLVTDLLGTSSLSSSTLTRIETWLSAYFYHLWRLRIDTQKADVVTQKFQFKVDVGLSQNQYGIAAMAMDTTGTLANWNKSMIDGGPKKVGITFLGLKEEDRT